MKVCFNLKYKHSLEEDPLACISRLKLINLIKPKSDLISKLIRLSFTWRTVGLLLH